MNKIELLNDLQNQVIKVLDSKSVGQCFTYGKMVTVN
jgi:hypothetical protein